jgi:thiol-disulfide isomerase/thioredoxin
MGTECRNALPDLATQDRQAMSPDREIICFAAAVAVPSRPTHRLVRVPPSSPLVQLASHRRAARQNYACIVRASASEQELPADVPVVAEDAKKDATNVVTEATPGTTATERMNAILGRNFEEARTQQQKEMAELAAANAKKKRTEVSTAVAAVVVGFLLAVFDAVNPRSPTALLQLMEATSAPVSAIGNGNPTLVDVYAEWCTNCKAMAGDLYELEESPLGAGVNFITLNADKPESAELMDRLHVDGIPHIAVLDKTGNVKATLIGKVPISILKDDLSAVLDDRAELPYPGFAGDDPILQ